MALYVLYEQKMKARETKESIITTVTKLIKAELRDLDKMNKVYSTFDELFDIKDQKEWVPKTLQLLLGYLTPSELEQVIIISFFYFFF